MWIYTKHGFYSIVQDRDDPDMLIVRARVKGDLEALWPEAIPKETPDNDYRYRIKVHKLVANGLIAREVTGINYPNYKDCVSDSRRLGYYSTVWAAMIDMQEDLKLDTNKD